MVNYLSVPPTLQRPCWYVGSLVSGILQRPNNPSFHDNGVLRVFGSVASDSDFISVASPYEDRIK